MASGATERPSLAVVLPALNEAEGLAAALASLRAQTEPAERLLVVDGGSADGTARVAAACGAEVFTAAGGGRGGQIAAGVRAVGADVVLVAHADMLFPPHALERVRRLLAQRPGCPGGCLGHRFASDGWVYRVIEWFDRRRARMDDLGD